MDRYSRIVAILKVALPLSALAMLSILFFLSQSDDYTARIPFADAEIEEMTRTHRIMAPVHATVTPAGDEVIVLVGSASPHIDDTLAHADSVVAEITFASGGRADILADRIETTQDPNILRLVDNVRVTSSLGDKLETDFVDTATNTVDVRAPGPVSGQSYLGQLDAGTMRITNKNAVGDIHMLFTQGVKLIYDPKQTERP